VSESPSNSSRQESLSPCRLLSVLSSIWQVHYFKDVNTSANDSNQLIYGNSVSRSKLTRCPYRTEGVNFVKPKTVHLAVNLDRACKHAPVTRRVKPIALSSYRMITHKITVVHLTLTR